MKFIFHFSTLKFSLKILFFQLFQIILFVQKSKESNQINESINTNIIKFSQANLRYIDFTSNSNSDMIFYAATNPKSSLRAFYGIKNNGRPYFKNSLNEDTYFHTMNGKEPQYKFECVIIFIKFIEDNSEYLMSVGKFNSHVEIYDFNKNTITAKSIDCFSGVQSVESFRNDAIPLFSPNSSENLYLFGFSTKESNINKFSLQIHKFKSMSNFENENSIVNKISLDNAYDYRIGVSCFQTKNYTIVCFYLTRDKKCNVILFDSYLYEKNRYSLDNYTIEEELPFYKCIHLKKEIGVFAYYGNNNKLIFLFKSFENYRALNYTFSSIFLSDKIFSRYLLTNDLIKLNGNKICFASFHKQKTIINFVIINLFFNDEKYKIRYFLLKVKDLFGIYLFIDISFHNYNNFISLGFSFCNQEKCEKDTDEHYAALMILNYANSTDSYFDVYQNLMDKYDLNKNFTDLSIDLEKEVKIDNNFFGYIFSGILMQNFSNCYNIKLISSFHNEIHNNYTLRKNELIKMLFKEDNYSSFNCNFEYSYIITEPDLNEYDKKFELIEGFNETNEIDFKKEEYKGKLGYYNIILNESLSKNCYDKNCDLCLKKNISFCITCKYNFTFTNITNEKICLNKTEKIVYEKEYLNKYLNASKDELPSLIPDIINKIKIGNTYEFEGIDFIMLIKPLDSPDISYFTKVNFSTCEETLREYYDIPLPRTITFLQVEINNTNDKSLVNQIEYEAYDDNKTKIDISICQSNIQVQYLIKPNSSLDISSINSFKDSNIDILNIKDKFFSDICYSFSYNDNDVILEDRILDFFQNFSLCEENCLFNEVDLDSMTIMCNCSVKNNLSVAEPSIKLEQLEDIETSLSLSIIKCYNLAFSWNNKTKNIGFWLFLFLIIIYIALIFLYFYKGIKPIKEYIFKEMAKYGYINEKGKKKETKKIKARKKSSSFPPKKKQNTSINSKIKLKSSRRDIIGAVNDDKSVKKKNKKSKGIIFYRKKEQNLSLSLQPTKVTTINESNSKKKDNFNLNLITINLKNKKSINLPDSTSNNILNIYTFEEAIKKDFRPTLKIMYVYLLTKQAIFHAFLYRSPLELFPLRFCLLIFIILNDFALNALFYFDDKISEKYRYKKNIFLFALTKNVTIILISTFIGFIILTLFINLSNSTNSIRDVFKKEEDKIKNNKKYKVSEKKKEEIKGIVEKILKKYQIKVIIFIIIQILLLIFYWYYVTIFCHIYSSTQISWIIDSLLSMVFRFFVDVILCMLFAKLYRIGISSNFHWIYKVSMFFYSFC